MATAGTKLTRVLSRFFINNVNNKPSRVMGSGSSFNGLAKYSTSASTAVKDYEDYRKSLYGDISHRALLVDAVGTLVVPSQPMAQVLTCVCLNCDFACFDFPGSGCFGFVDCVMRFPSGDVCVKFWFLLVILLICWALNFVVD